MTSTSKPARILVFSGSIRSESLNKRLAAAAAKALQSRTDNVALIDLAEFDAPLYNGDDEATNGVPPRITELKKLFVDAQALVIACPEYNGFIPPLLVNTFSWLSRPENGEPSQAFNDKVAIIMGASPGGLGAIRVMPRLRDSLAELGVTVLPRYVTVKSAFDAFDDDGNLAVEADATMLASQIDKLLAALAR